MELVNIVWLAVVKNYPAITDITITLDECCLRSVTATLQVPNPLRFPMQTLTTALSHSVLHDLADYF